MCGHVAAKVKQIIVEIGGENAPQTIWQLRRLLQRFDVILILVPPSWLREPFLVDGLLYFPEIRPFTCERLHKWLLHELAHACLLWDGEPPFILPVEWGTRHDIARMVEDQ